MCLVIVFATPPPTIYSTRCQVICFRFLICLLLISVPSLLIMTELSLFVVEKVPVLFFRLTAYCYISPSRWWWCCFLFGTEQQFHFVDSLAAFNGNGDHSLFETGFRWTRFLVRPYRGITVRIRKNTVLVNIVPDWSSLWNYAGFVLQRREIKWRWQYD